MNRLFVAKCAMAAVFLGMLAANLVSLPRGPLLNCYKDVTTYTAHPASYGFPFEYMRGSGTGSACLLPINNGQNYQVYDYSYRFHAMALAMDAAVALVLVAVIYYIGAKSGGSKNRPARTSHPKRLQPERT